MSASSASSPSRTSRARPASAVSAHKAAHKGQQTKAAIVDVALGMATHVGVEGLSIGALAEAMQMSKSGVFAHFGSREELQIAVVAEYHRRFEEEVFFSALREPRGLPRLRALFENWVRQVAVELESGCIYISGAVEFDDRPGPVREALVTMVKAWHAALHKAIGIAVDEGHLDAHAPVAQILFELHGLILSLHHDARFLRSDGALEHARRGFDRVVTPDLTPAGRLADEARVARKPARATRSAR